MESKKKTMAKLMALKFIAEEVISTLNECEIENLFELDSNQGEKFSEFLVLDELKEKYNQLQEENEMLKKGLREYEILLNCLELENYNPTKFQKGDDNEDDSINGFTSNSN